MMILIYVWIILICAYSVSKSSGELMHLLKKRASAPIITKVADAPYELISMDIFAADLYGRLCHSQQNEFTHGVVII